MMKKQENFNDLIASIQEAFIQANKIDHDDGLVF